MVSQDNEREVKASRTLRLDYEIYFEYLRNSVSVLLSRKMIQYAMPFLLVLVIGASVSAIIFTRNPPKGDSSNGTGYKTIVLAPHLKPVDQPNKTKTTIGDVLLQYGREEEHLGIKTPAVGSLDLSVETNGNFGFFSAVLASYNNHMALRTTPEDWWYTIIYKVALDIDANAAKTSVRQFFVSHEGKKQLPVNIGHDHTVSTVDYNWFLDQMTKKIASNIKVPKYVDILRADFSTSTDIHVISSQITVMASVQEYFEYEMSFWCGIPALEMEGNLEDWKRLKDKFQKLQNILAPIRGDIGIKESWWSNVRKICDHLIDTFNGKPDGDWWSHIFSTREGFASGGYPPTYYEGWFITEFLGLKDISNLSNLQNGIITVLMMITKDSVKEKSVFAAGIAGYQVFEKETWNDQQWDSVKAAHGWALMLEPNSVFRN